MACTDSPTCVPWELDSSCCEGWDDLDDELKCRAEVLAWDTIRLLTGGQVGNCPVIMRPCLVPPCNACAQAMLQPVVIGGEWYNSACGRGHPCSCTPICEITFPGPIAMLIAVISDGVEVPLDSFRIDNGHLLVREDGGCWPSCQNMGAPLGSPGTLGITYVPGIIPDSAGLGAAGVLACEYTKACQGGKCRLPSSVTNIARQGVSFTLSAGMFLEGTGIREVDAWIDSVNPGRLRRPSLVWSPDLPAARHRWQSVP